MFTDTIEKNYRISKNKTFCCLNRKYLKYKFDMREVELIKSLMN